MLIRRRRSGSRWRRSRRWDKSQGSVRERAIQGRSLQGGPLLVAPIYLDSVSARILSVVEGFIGHHNDPVFVIYLHRLIIGGNTLTDRDVTGLVVPGIKESGLHYGRSDTLGYLHRGRTIRLREDYQKLFSPVAGNQVGFPHNAGYDAIAASQREGRNVGHYALGHHH